MSRWALRALAEKGCMGSGERDRRRETGRGPGWAREWRQSPRVWRTPFFHLEGGWRGAERGRGRKWPFSYCSTHCATYKASLERGSSSSPAAVCACRLRLQTCKPASQRARARPVSLRVGGACAPDVHPDCLSIVGMDRGVRDGREDRQGRHPLSPSSTDPPIPPLGLCGR